MRAIALVIAFICAGCTVVGPIAAVGLGALGLVTPTTKTHRVIVGRESYDSLSLAGSPEH
jgi:hypothetical protein